MRISDWSSDVCSSDLEGSANDHTILGLDQGVVVAVPGPGLGELGVQLIEQVRNAPVDVFATIVRMHPTDAKGEAGEHLFEYRQEIRLGDALARSEERRVGKECVSTCRSRWSP